MTDNLYEAAKKGDLNRVQELVMMGVRADEPIINGNSPLHAAVSGNHLDVVIYLINNGAYQHRLDSSGKSSLHIATRMRNTEMLSYLIGKEVNIFHRDVQGQTPLMAAVLSDNPENVQLLLEQGAADYFEAPFSPSVRRSYHCEKFSDVVAIIEAFRNFFMNTVGSSGLCLDDNAAEQLKIYFRGLADKSADAAAKLAAYKVIRAILYPLNQKISLSMLKFRMEQLENILYDSDFNSKGLRSFCITIKEFMEFSGKNMISSLRTGCFFSLERQYFETEKTSRDRLGEGLPEHLQEEFRSGFSCGK